MRLKRGAPLLMRPRRECAPHFNTVDGAKNNLRTHKAMKMNFIIPDSPIPEILFLVVSPLFSLMIRKLENYRFAKLMAL